MNAKTKSIAAEAALKRVIERYYRPGARERGLEILSEGAHGQCVRAVSAYANKLADKIESSPLPPTARQLKDLEVCELMLRVLQAHRATPPFEEAHT